MKESLARRLLLSALAVAGFLVLAEGVLSWGYAFWKARESVTSRARPEQQHARHDAELGWTNVPGALVRDLYGPGKNFTANAQGFRAREEYGASIPAGRCRVVFAGDSFTMGFGVGDDATYPARVENLEPRIQSVNLGMGAYGADQAFLRYRRDAAGVQHNVVVFAFIAHDFRRMELDYYMAPKPRLALANGKLVVENAPVPERDSRRDARTALAAFLQHLDLGRVLSRALRALTPAQTQGDAERIAAANRSIPAAAVAEAMFEELAALARERSAKLLLVYLPTLGELELEAQPVRDWAERAARSRGLAFVDATPAFRGREAAPLFGRANHYSEAGNTLVAEALLPELRGQCGLAPAATASEPPTAPTTP